MSSDVFGSARISIRLEYIAGEINESSMFHSFRNVGADGSSSFNRGNILNEALNFINKSE
jgi:hypothetical protein